MSLSVSRIVADREWRNQRTARTHLRSHPALVHTLALETRLTEHGHRGCVNRLAWNATGSRLLSGSDDRHLIVWDVAKRKPVSDVRTLHHGNIFGVGFLPHSNDTHLLSAAADDSVFMHTIDSTGAAAETCTFFGCHSQRVKALCVQEDTPHLFWTAASDGKLCQFDTRSSHTCRARPDMALDTTAACSSQLLQDPSALYSVAVSPAFAYHIAVAGNSSVRLYDRRMLSLGATRRPQPLALFRGRDAKSETNATHITFSKDGTTLLANYSCNHVYTYDIFDTESRQQSKQLVMPLRNSNPETLHNRTTAHHAAALNETPDQPVPTSPAYTRLQLTAASKAASEGLDLLQSHELPSVAIYHFSAAIAQTPRNPDLFKWRAGAFEARNWLGDQMAALRDIAQALARAPDDADMLLAQIRLLRRLKLTDVAAAAADRVRQSHPDLSSEIDKILKPFSGTSGHGRVSDDDGDGDDSNDREEDDGEEDESVDDGPERLNPFYEPRRERRALRGRQRRWTDDDGSDDNNDSNDDDEHDDDDDDDDDDDGDSDETADVTYPYAERFVGSINCQTDIKEANFFGENDEYIVAGSDDGNIYVWERRTGNLALVLHGDRQIVNCVQPHPTECLLATSGIEDSVALWAPRAAEGCDTLDDPAIFRAQNRRRQDAAAIPASGRMLVLPEHLSELDTLLEANHNQVKDAIDMPLNRLPARSLSLLLQFARTLRNSDEAAADENAAVAPDCVTS